jgi:hypothetical protein
MNTPEPVRSASLVARTPTSPVPPDYSDKWERMWSAGISKGEVGIQVVACARMGCGEIVARVGHAYVARSRHVPVHGLANSLPV